MEKDWGETTPFMLGLGCFIILLFGTGVYFLHHSLERTTPSTAFVEIIKMTWVVLIVASVIIMELVFIFKELYNSLIIK